MPGKSRPLEQRFWEKVDRRGPHECWPWTAKTAGVPSHQYGMIHSGVPHNKLLQSTHVSWYLRHGWWPVKYILHTCDNPLCVNPSHLEHGDARKNALDVYDRGRKVGFSKPIPKKLTSEDVKNIIRRYKSGLVSQQRLADEYNVGQTIISAIVRGRAWKHVSGVS